MSGESKLRDLTLKIVAAAVVIATGAMAAAQRDIAREKGAQEKAAQEKTATSGLGGAGPVVRGTPEDPLRDPRERHLRHVKQLTFGGQNAEAYFSYYGRRLIFMSGRAPYACDQILIMNAFPQFSPDGEKVVFVSNRNAKVPHEINVFIADWVP